MKTKHLLTALALPAVFAACSSEELVQENQVLDSALQNRPAVDLTINAYKQGGESAESRVVGGDYNGGIRWYWEDENDKIGAVVVDFVKNGGGQIVDASTWEKYVITNYPFAPQIDGLAAKANFQTPTAVVEGAYIFYNRYDGEMTKRGKITHSIPRILTASEGHEEGLNQVGTPENGGQNFFISPIYQIAVADGEEVETNVGMKAVHSILKFTLKTDLKKSDSDPNYYYDKGFKVSKIELQTLGSKKFDRTFVLNPKTLADAQLKALNAYRDAATTQAEKIRRQSLYSPITGEILSMDITNDYVEEATKVVTDYITNPNNSALGMWSDNTPTLTYELDEPYVFNGKDQSMELMVVVPAAEYEQATGQTPYEEKTQGVFLMKVYTSEGIYNSYLLTSELKANASATDWILTNNKYTLARGVQYTMPTKTMKIDGGQTNITLFEQNEEFIVETTSDWNYTIEYIQEHYRDYGNSNSWKTPQVKFANSEAVITVDADHYFPNFPIKYTGAKTLSLVGQDEYVFDPVTAIFATGTERPTLQIVNQPEATFEFKGNVNDAIKNYKGGNSTDGVDATHAVKLVADAQVEIAAGQKVNFEHLESATALTLNEGALVNVSDATHQFKTAGVVNVLSEANLIVEKNWANAADVDIETEASVLVKEQTINVGTVDVWGNLNVKDFMNGYATTIGKVALKQFNSTKGELVVKGYAEGMNNAERGIAEFIYLTNSSISSVTTEVSSSSKANYGGWIIIGTKNENKTSVNSGSGKLTNYGLVNVYGELMAANVESSNMITLGGDPYALLILLEGNVTAGPATAAYKGSVVLEDASEYPMFDNYYTKWNDISGVTGTIETEIDNATYQKAFANLNNENYGTKERALQVLNKITLVDEVLVKHHDENADIEFVLADDAKLNAYKNNTIVKAITVEGENTAITATPESGLTTQTITIANAGLLNVKKNAEVVVENKANVIFNQSADAMINIAGSLTNQGYIDVLSTGAKTYVNTNITVDGEFINEGKLATASEEEVKLNDNLEAVETFISKFGKKLIGDRTVAGVYKGNSKIGSVSNNEWNQVSEVSADLFKEIVANGKKENKQGYVVYYYKTGGVYYYIWADDYSDFDKVQTEANSTVALSGRTMFDQVVDKVTGTANYSKAYASWFNVVNEGLLDLLYSADAENTNSWAYGQSLNGAKATKSGKFNNELETESH